MILHHLKRRFALTPFTNARPRSLLTVIDTRLLQMLLTITEDPHQAKWYREELEARG